MKQFWKIIRFPIYFWLLLVVLMLVFGYDLDKDKEMYVNDKTLVYRLVDKYFDKKSELDEICRAVPSKKFGKELVFWNCSKQFGRAAVINSEEWKDYSTDFFYLLNVMKKYYDCGFNKCPYGLFINDYDISFVFENYGFRNKNGNRAYLLFSRCHLDSLKTQFPDYEFQSNIFYPVIKDTDSGRYISTHSAPPNAEKWFYQIDENWYIVSP